MNSGNKEDEKASGGLRNPFVKGFLKNLPKTFTGAIPRLNTIGGLPALNFRKSSLKYVFAESIYQVQEDSFYMPATARGYFWFIRFLNIPFQYIIFSNDTLD
jgi:hypothetical protein